MSTPRWTDDAGHDWPVTGDWCDACGLPLRRLGGADVHPSCGDSEPSEPSEDSAVPALPTFAPPTDLPGRCPSCGFHIEKQGHGDTCPERSAS